MVQLVNYGYVIKDDLKNPSDACGITSHTTGQSIII
jgi:hypothetical protein